MQVSFLASTSPTLYMQRWQHKPPKGLAGSAWSELSSGWSSETSETVRVRRPAGMEGLFSNNVHKNQSYRIERKVKIKRSEQHTNQRNQNEQLVRTTGAVEHSLMHKGLHLFTIWVNISRSCPRQRVGKRDDCNNFSTLT